MHPHRRHGVLLRTDPGGGSVCGGQDHGAECADQGTDGAASGIGHPGRDRHGESEYRSGRTGTVGSGQHGRERQYAGH